jgi:hypothetical protein
MIKISQQAADQVVQMAKRAAAGIRLLVAENAALREKLASRELDSRIGAIKLAMDQSGAVNPWGSEEARDAALRKKAADGKLEVLEEALRIVPDLSIAKIGELVDGSAKGESKPSTVAKAELDGWVMGAGG